MMAHARDVPDGSVLQADICIVGAGAAGISLALALEGTGLDVLLMESGELTSDSKSQELYAGEVANEALHSPPIHYRVRQFGGSTTLWGGRCVPLDPQDFEPRQAVPLSGWPISAQDVYQYYPAATALCEAGEADYYGKTALPPGTRPLFTHTPGPRIDTEGLERFSCPTDFGRRYAQRLQSAARVMLGANCLSIHLQPDGNQVASLKMGSLAGNCFHVRARAYVLAVGGLETPRLLLASRDVHTSGVGNAYDVVGRYYMSHLAGSVGLLEAAGGPADVRHGYEVSEDGTYCRRRISLTPQAQRDLGVANMVARLHFPTVADPSHGNSVLSGIFLSRPFLGYEYKRRVANPEDTGVVNHLRHMRNILRYPHDAVAFLTHWTLKRKLAQRKFPSVILRNRSNRFSLEINAEQIPQAESRVTLSSTTDALGLPRVHVDWRYAKQDIESVARSLRAISEDFHHTGSGRFTFDPSQLEHDLTCYGAYGGHHIGTARMGLDPRTSVVNSDARVHGVANLYLAGSAVFPTSGQANPTLTLVALALRLAGHLANQLTGRHHDASQAVM